MSSQSDRQTGKQEPAPGQQPEVVGVFSGPAADKRPAATAKRARKTDRIGYEAAKSAILWGAIVGLVGAALFALVLWAITDVSLGVIVASSVGLFASLFIVVGGLWGAFTRLSKGRNVDVDWREAMPDRPDAKVVDRTSDEVDADTPLVERRVDELEGRGAVKVIVTDEPVEPAGLGSSGTPTGEQLVSPGERAPGFAAPSTRGQELRYEDFAGKVPVVLAFAPSGTQTEVALASLDDVHPEFGRLRVQLLVVAPAGRDDLVTAARNMNLDVPLLADGDGRLARDHGITRDGETFAAVFIDRAGKVSEAMIEPWRSEHAQVVLDTTRKLVEAEPERFGPVTASGG